MKLYHYSDKNFNKTISPKHFGENPYTKHSAELSNIKRSFFYVSTGHIEYHLNNSKFLYLAEVDKSSLYDINLDVKNFKNCKSIHEFIKKIKDHKYKGFYDNEQAHLFYAVSIKEKITL